MKNTKFKTNRMSAVLAALTLLMVLIGCSAEKPAAPPTEAESQALVKSTLSDFANAIDKGDFAAFKANASKEFQTQFSDDQLKTSFKSFIDQKEVVVPILRDAATKNAKFASVPAPREEKGNTLLKTDGAVDSEPQPVEVKNDYVYQDGKWKLLTIGVELK